MERIVERLLAIHAPELETRRRCGTRCSTTFSITPAEILSPFNVFRYITVRTVYASLTAMFLAFVFGPWLIRKLRELQIGQYIREEGPQNHQKKAAHLRWRRAHRIVDRGSDAAVGGLSNGFVLLALFALLAFAAIGLSTITRRCQSSGISGSAARTNFCCRFCKLAVGIGLLILATRSAYSTELMIPFLKRVHPDWWSTRC